jgi:hypothetical protein
MSDVSPGEIAQRKALLASRSELERMQITLLVHDLHERIALPPRDEDRAGPGRAGRIAAAVVGIGVPLLGRRRLARTLRFASIGLTALRIARNWRSTAR